eukprot:15434524-Alexandrium_andersonii.AAC.1
MAWILSTSNPLNPRALARESPVRAARRRCSPSVSGPSARVRDSGQIAGSFGSRKCQGLSRSRSWLWLLARQ